MSTELREKISAIQSDLYNAYYAKIQFRDKIYGGLPKQRELVENYVKAKFNSDDIYPVAEDLDFIEEAEKMTTGFKGDKTGIYIGSYQVKAALKQYASLLKLTTKKRGTKQTVKETLFVKGVLNSKLTGDKIYFQPRRQVADGLEDFVGHVSDHRGTRSFLRSAEYVEQGILEFQVWVAKVRMSNQKELTQDDLLMMLTFGQECGIGSCRGLEAGKFDLVKFEPVS